MQVLGRRWTGRGKGQGKFPDAEVGNSSRQYERAVMNIYLVIFVCCVPTSPENACPQQVWRGNAVPVPQGSVNTHTGGSWHRLQGQMLTLKENSKNNMETSPHEVWKVRSVGTALQSPQEPAPETGGKPASSPAYLECQMSYRNYKTQMIYGP